HILGPSILNRGLEKFVDADLPFTIAVAITHPRTVCHQHRGWIRSVSGDTWADIEDRMVLVLSLPREAGIATSQPAGHGTVTKIPATRPRQDVPANRRHVPELRRGGQRRRLGQSGEMRDDERVVLDLRERGERPKGDAASVQRNLIGKLRQAL